MTRLRDDGHGKKTSENYECKVEDGLKEYEVQEDVIEDLGSGLKTVINRGKTATALQDEWESTRVIYFKENFELISKKGRNITGAWNESWYDKDGREKWSRKEGQNFIT